MKVEIFSSSILKQLSSNYFFLLHDFLFMIYNFSDITVGPVIYIFVTASSKFK